MGAVCEAQILILVVPKKSRTCQDSRRENQFLVRVTQVTFLPLRDAEMKRSIFQSKGEKAATSSTERAERAGEVQGLQSRGMKICKQANNSSSLALKVAFKSPAGAGDTRGSQDSGGTKCPLIPQSAVAHIQAALRKSSSPFCSAHLLLKSADKGAMLSPYNDSIFR